MAADAGEQHDTADEDDDQDEDGGDLPAPATGIAWHGLHLTRFLFGRSPELPAEGPGGRSSPPERSGGGQAANPPWLGARAGGAGTDGEAGTSARPAGDAP